MKTCGDESAFLGMEARVIRLEENAWFQERKLHELEEHALELGSRLDSLERQFESLRKAFLDFQNEALAAHTGEHAIANPPPPHWQQEK